MTDFTNTSTADPFAPLVDSFGRVHTSLRLSVTDRCNIRCFYCMPAENVKFLPRSQILTFEEIVRFTAVAARMGVRTIRITGGEPLVRAELPKLIEQLASVDGVDEVAVTTNGMLLVEQAQALRHAGVARLNVSLDTLDPERFEQMTRRAGLDKVLAGIAEAQRVGFDGIRLNAIAVQGESEAEVVPLARFAIENGLELRFIEFMPLDAEQQWATGRVLTGDRIREILEQEFGPMEPASRPDSSQPAIDYQFTRVGGSVGFINSVSQPFCGDCNRLRLTAEGQVRNCLFSTTEWDARKLLRTGATDLQLAALVRDCVAGKRAGHGIDQPGFLRPERAMYQIGG